MITSARHNVCGCFAVITVLIGASVASAEDGGGTQDLFASSLKALGALVLVLALIFIAAWLVKRYLKFLPQGGIRGDGIKVIAVRAIGPKRSIHILEVGGKKFLVGSTESSVNLLKEFSESDRVEVLPERSDFEDK
ncbi:flagellar biosynthetic protein FliO [candidate division LCP-89 bacterium B3_LCP]|uniref:Flagellar protein n=1 Tax=candidate division LCP-89 bacterium B3_LCP TaxID=2012998 RepID=A0A532V4Y9_UNCL8|nr:MAG: flagellar biosynthetic protein FliO [candidate division LCP-89 bacterium B3_LCP]